MSSSCFSLRGDFVSTCNVPTNPLFKLRSINYLIVLLALLLFTPTSPAAGLVVAWGDNSNHQTDIPPDLTNVVAVAGGSVHSLALDATGAVTGWGDAGNGQTIAPALANPAAIAAGDSFSLALQADGDIIAWGLPPAVPATPTHAVAVAASAGNAMGLIRDGTVIPWGTVAFTPENATNLVAIAAGHTFDLGLQGDGTVIGWGDNGQGETDIPPGLTNVVALAAGRFHCLALSGNGTVTAWGDNSFDQLNIPAGLSNVVAIAAGGIHSVALRRDGTIVTWGNDSYQQLDLPAGLVNVAGIAAGRYHSLAILGDGSPVITVPPLPRYNSSTKTAVLQVMAVGQSPLTYQWQLDGTNIVNATNSVLLLPNLLPGNAGTYSVIVSNTVGYAASTATHLPPAWQHPFIASQPEDTNVLCNETAVFQVDAAGTGPLSYQWTFAGTVLPDATNSVLVLDHVSLDQSGEYTVKISNAFGVVTSQVATLTVEPVPPLITSPLTASAKQGVAFSYTITGLHDPTSFIAPNLPFGLGLDPMTGEIQGTPIDAGTFDVTIGAVNHCTTATTNLVLTIASSTPVITSSLSVTGAEQVPFTYQITSSEPILAYGVSGLPRMLALDPATGIISGTPLYGGEFDAQISASNDWGVATATLHFSFSNAPIAGLAIENVTTNYTSPYLMDFQFALRDGADPAINHAVVVDPRLLTVTALEDGTEPTEIEKILRLGSAKVLKAYLVLDFTASVASLANGDTNNDGISDAVDTEVNGATTFVNQQPADAQIGVYEFHREDVAPHQVTSLTTDKELLTNAIAGIWTNYVQNFPAGSRCWDALVAAIGSLGSPNPDEQHYIILVSDGRDESSTNTITNVISAATNNNVHIYCVGFGDALDVPTLQNLSAQTSGRFYEATNSTALAANLAQIGKDLNGQYILRWATLKRSATPFMPSFQISYQGFTAVSPPNPDPIITGTNITVDPTTDPPTTNIDYTYKTNYIIAPYPPTSHAGNVTVGSLRLAADADIHPSGLTLRATYVPRYIRQLRLHYRSNWPCTVSLESTNDGEMLYGWSLTQTNDDAGGQWLLLSSADPQNRDTSIPFSAFGKLVTFTFHDVIDASSAFSVFELDNSIYTNTGGQSFTFENTNAFLTDFPVLPHGTPIPWLFANGFSPDYATAELGDPDGDGVPTWQEYQAGTDPNDANSVFRVKNVAPTDTYGRYQITFSTAVNRMYRLESSSDLLNWVPLVSAIVGTGSDITVTDIRNPTENSQAYYRVVVY